VTRQPIRIVAETPTGFGAADPWSPALDAILAYWVLREQLGEEVFALGGTGHLPLVEADLPLARETHSDWWWWQVSSPIVAAVGEHRRYFHRRFDLAEAAQYTSVRKVETKAGPYKAYRNTVRLVLTPTVTWHAVGDIDAVRALLARVDAIGAKVGQGCGRVVRWHVSDDGDPHLARFHRPLPLEFAVLHDCTGVRLRWGIRPPGRVPEHQTLCVMPGGDDAEDRGEAEEGVGG
jgi:CRISPR type IV-associated protein Csf3